MYKVAEVHGGLLKNDLFRLIFFFLFFPFFFFFSFLFYKRKLTFLFFFFLFLLSIIMLRVHFDGDFVVQSGRELLDVALTQLSRLRVGCLVV